MSGHLGKIAAAQAAQAEQHGAGATGPTGGRLSARLLAKGGSEQLRLENTGDEPLEVVDVQVLEQPDVLVQGGGDPRGAHMDPGEHTAMLIGLSIANTLPLKILMRWRDSRGVQDRVQQVALE